MADVEARYHRGQVVPAPEWQAVRTDWSGYSVVRVIDEAEGVDEFRLLSPREDLSDRRVDGQTFFSVTDAEKEMPGWTWWPLPPQTKEKIRAQWDDRN